MRLLTHIKAIDGKIKKVLVYSPSPKNDNKCWSISYVPQNVATYTEKNNPSDSYINRKIKSYVSWNVTIKKIV